MKKFQTLGKSLSKDEQRMILGGTDEEDQIDPGDGGSSGGCCAHAVDRSYFNKCGLTMQQAQDEARDFAIRTGGHGYWCCASC